MKKILFAVFLSVYFVLGAEAQRPVMSDLFKAMPDSLMPYLTKNNRLDMIDFMEAKMKAEVTNSLEGKSVMTALTADSLSIIMSNALQVDMKLLEHGDSMVVCMQKTYKISEHQVEKIVQLFSTVWCPLSEPEIVSSSLLKRDEKLFHF